MRTRALGMLGWQVSELALGTWGLSGDGYGTVSPEEATAVIERALDLGITLFDTCDAYGRGSMEQLLGKLLESKRDSTVVVTRVGTDRSVDPALKRFDADYLQRAVAASAQRLGRDPLDVVLLHNPRARVIEQGEAVETMRRLEKEGTIRAWGVSVGSVDAALAAVEAGTPVISLAYNLLHTTELNVIASEAAMKGIAVLAHTVLAYGLLTFQWGSDRWFDEGDHRRERWNADTLRERVRQREVARKLVQGDVSSPRSAALRFVLSNSLIASAILGPRTTGQLEQLVQDAGNGPPYLSEQALREVQQHRLAAGIVD